MWNSVCEQGSPMFITHLLKKGRGGQGKYFKCIKHLTQTEQSMPSTFVFPDYFNGQEAPWSSSFIAFAHCCPSVDSWIVVTSIGRAQKRELRETGSSPILAKAVLTCLSHNKVLGTFSPPVSMATVILPPLAVTFITGKQWPLLGVYLFWLGVLLPPVSTHCLTT